MVGWSERWHAPTFFWKFREGNGWMMPAGVLLEMKIKIPLCVCVVSYFNNVKRLEIV
jgi:hypothetical protein